MVGPTIQNDIFTILTKWRTYEIGFIADIEKMYKQIWVADEDAKFQRVLWRDNPSKPMQQLLSTTVTFGAASAPFQAIRAIKQIAENERNNFPLAAKALEYECYVDDVVSGAEDQWSAINKQKQLVDSLSKYGYNLRKWATNNPFLLKHIPVEHREMKEISFNQENNAIKTLGIKWDPAGDWFKYKIQAPTETQKMTKRKLVSEICKLFHPLGWLSPPIIKSKILIQSLWKSNIEWDEMVPESILSSWLRIVSELPALEHIQINRWLGLNSQTQWSTHAFCDASEAAYAASVYARIEHSTGEISCNLIAAKTKVSPLKVVSLPRLELCGAVLLAKLVRKVMRALSINTIEIHGLTDSQIARAWISKHPSIWKTFVANRVSEIQSTIPSATWHHVPSEFNPADVSRGIYPQQLLTEDQWWHGPKFLSRPANEWPQQSSVKDIHDEQRVQVMHTQISDNDVIDELLHNVSKFQRAIRTIAYCLRWKRCAKEKWLTADELHIAEKIIVKRTQLLHFAVELECLSKQQTAPKTSRLQSLLPYIDTTSDIGEMRVRGRLDNAPLHEDQRHPMIIPHQSRLTELIINKAHIECNHQGEQATLRKTREKYWIVRGRQAIRNIIRKCVRCHRFSAKMQQQLMADLPPARVTPSSPFTHTGVDFAGPIEIKSAVESSTRDQFVDLLRMQGRSKG